MVHECDPVNGCWAVDPCETSCTVWTDANSVALGCCVEIAGNTVEDGAWLRRQNDRAHINVSELDAVLRGLNMALEWRMKNVILRSDSWAVVRWISNTLNKSEKVKVNGISEMLVLRRSSSF